MWIKISSWETALPAASMSIAGNMAIIQGNYLGERMDHNNRRIRVGYRRENTEWIVKISLKIEFSKSNKVVGFSILRKTNSAIARQ